MPTPPAAPAAPIDGATFDHLGLVVKSLASGRRWMEAIGVRQWTAPIHDPVNGVKILFGRDAAGVVYELLEPIDASSPVHAALVQRKNILNHVGYLVPDLTAAAQQMRLASCGAVGDPSVAIAYGGARIQFFVSPLNFIIELIEAPGHAHAYV